MGEEREELHGELKPSGAHTNTQKSHLLLPTPQGVSIALARVFLEMFSKNDKAPKSATELKSTKGIFAPKHNMKADVMGILKM